MKKLMIYGATGYTGRMAADHASAAGTPLVLAGRNEAALAALAEALTPGTASLCKPPEQQGQFHDYVTISHQ
jgi:short subunit dehydrogenase-like uncharacterized protein